MSKKDKAQQDALDITNRSIQSHADVITQCLLNKHYKAAAQHLKNLSKSVNDLGKNIQTLLR